jgi:hypothetical protein
VKSGASGCRLPAAIGNRENARPLSYKRMDSSLPCLRYSRFPLPGNQAATRFAGTLVVHPDGQNGLTVPSVALVFQLGAVDKRDCLQQLGSLDSATLDQVFLLLDRLTGR